MTSKKNSNNRAVDGEKGHKKDEQADASSRPQIKTNSDIFKEPVKETRVISNPGSEEADCDPGDEEPEEGAACDIK